MTKSLTAYFLILMLLCGLLTETAKAYSCAKNYAPWTHNQALQYPLDLYERLALRDQRALLLGNLAFIRKDLQKVRSEIHAVLKEKGEALAEEAHSLREKNIPYKDLLYFYVRVAIALQSHYKSGEASDNLGFMANLETAKEFIATTEKHNPGGLPVLILPMHRNLSEADFVRTNAAPLYYAGITFKRRTLADGVQLGPADFFIHDLFHAEIMAMMLRNTINDLLAENPNLVPIALIQQWNQLANQRLNSDTEKPMFFQMHEQAEVIRP